MSSNLSSSSFLEEEEILDINPLKNVATSSKEASAMIMMMMMIN